MADKFLDHGAYTGGVFDGYISNTANSDNGVAGNTLTVTGVTSGTVNIGAVISGGGLPFGYVVAAFVSGTQGGIGVYTVRKAPVDSTVVLRATSGGAMASKFGLPLVTIPAARWGIPQEGDGSAKTAATASAVFSVDMTSMTAAAGNTISIMGSGALTCVASGATTDQFNAGSGATLAANIAAAINRTTNTRTVSAQATGWATPKVQDAVFARATGAVLEVMTRAGSSVYNGRIAMTATGITGWGSNPTWSGGSGGCWGYITNWTSAIWPSGIAALGYGPIVGNHIAGFVGSAASGGEDVYIRSGKHICIYLGSNNVFPIPTSTGSAEKPINFIFDDSTQWADGTYPQLQFTLNPQTSSGGSFVQGGQSANVRLSSKKYPDGTYGVKLNPVLGFTQSAVIAISQVTGATIEGFHIDAQTGVTPSSNGGVPAIVPFYQSNNARGTIGIIKSCKLSGKNNGPFFSSATGVGDVEIYDIECDGLGMAVPLTRAFNFSSVHSLGLNLTLENIRFTNLPNLSNAFDPADTVSSYLSAILSNVSWGTLKNKGPVFPAGIGYRYNRAVTAFSTYGSRDFSFDGPVLFYDWDSNGNYPLLNATLLDGITGWAMRVVLSRTDLAIGKSMVGELPRIAKVIPTSDLLAEAERTIAAELLIEQSLSLNRGDVSMHIMYQQPDGTVVSLDTLDPFGAALTASTASWTQSTSSSQVTWAGSVVLNKFKLEATTPTAVKAGSEISIYIRFHKKITNTTQVIFVDPEVVVA